MSDGGSNRPDNQNGGVQNAVMGCKIHEMGNAGPEGAGEKIGES